MLLGRLLLSRACVAIWLVAGGAIHAYTATFPDYEGLYREKFVKMMACGPLALLSVCDALQLPISKSDRDSILAVCEKGGTDMLTLKALAERQGLHALGARLSYRNLRRIGLPAILVWGEATFVAAIEYDGTDVTIHRPLESPIILSADEFTERFGDAFPCLLLSRNPIDAKKLDLDPEVIETSVNGPKPQFEKTVLSLGRIDRQEWSGQIQVRNIGDDTLKVRSIATSCSCLHGTIDKAEIAPGESTLLHLTGRQVFFGTVSQQVSLSTNDRGTGLAVLPVRGWLAPPVFFVEPVVVFEVDHASSKLSMMRDVKLIVPTGVRTKQLRTQLPAHAPLRASIVVGDDEKTASLHLQLTSDSIPPGWSRWEISVLDSPSENNNAMPAKLTAVVQSEARVMVSPPSLWIRANELEQMWHRKVTIHGTSEDIGSIDLNWQDESLAAMIKTHVSRRSPEGVDVSIEPAKTSSDSLVGRNTSLICSFGSKQRFEIPVQFGTPKETAK